MISTRKPICMEIVKVLFQIYLHSFCRYRKISAQSGRFLPIAKVVRISWHRNYNIANTQYNESTF